MSKAFRDYEKESLEPRVPVALANAVRVMAARQRRSISVVVAEAIARAVGHDPARYGIEPANGDAKPSSS